MAGLHRNAPCPCGSGKKLKHCCLRRLKRKRGEIELGEGAIALFKRGALEESIELFRRAVEVAPRSADARNNLGLALWRAGRKDGALASYRQALEIEPRHALARTNLGGALRDLGRAAEAISCLREAIAIDREFAPAHYNLGRALSDFGQVEEAAAAYREALRLAPGVAEIHNSLGLSLWELGQRADAIESFRTAIRLQPDFAKPYFNLHTVLISDGDAAGSVECLRKAVAAAPDDLEARCFLAVLLDWTGEHDAAQPLFGAVEAGPAWVRAELDSYRYIRSLAQRPRLIGTSIDAFELGLRAARADGMVLEFGVRFGTSIRQVAGLAKQTVHGFDSFEGLPEAWHEEARGSYSTLGALPALPSNVVLHPGWFDRSLPRFLRSHPGPVRFVHIDCDLYSSARCVLELLAQRILPGTVIVFDDYLGHEHWREDEFRAFQEAVREEGWRYEYLAFSLCTRQAVVRLLQAGTGDRETGRT